MCGKGSHTINGNAGRELGEVGSDVNQSVDLGGGIDYKAGIGNSGNSFRSTISYSQISKQL